MTDMRMQNLENQVDIIKDFLLKHNIDIPFFIAGGSVFSILNSKEYNTTDIDVYCYSQSDVDKMKNIQLSDNYKMHVTERALTFTSNVKCNRDCDIENFNILVSDQLEHHFEVKTSGRIIQFIIMSFGNPQQVFKTFDFNCSSIAFTSEHELVHAENFSKYLKVNINNFHSDILRRYEKYTSYKGAIDKDNKIIFELFDYCIEHKDVAHKTKYKEEKSQNGLTILKYFIGHSVNEDYINHIHDKIVQYYNKETCFDIFKELYKNLQNTRNSQYCDELNVHYLIDDHDQLYDIQYPDTAHQLYSNHLNTADTNRIMLQYPEYFI